MTACDKASEISVLFFDHTNSRNNYLPKPYRTSSVTLTATII